MKLLKSVQNVKMWNLSPRCVVHWFEVLDADTKHLESRSLHMWCIRIFLVLLIEIPELRMHGRGTQQCHNHKFVPRNKEGNDITYETQSMCHWIEDYMKNRIYTCFKCTGSGDESSSSLSSEGGMITYGMWTIMKGNVLSRFRHFQENHSFKVQCQKSICHFFAKNQ